MAPPFGTAGPYERMLSQSLFRRRSEARAQPDHRRYRSCAAHVRTARWSSRRTFTYLRPRDPAKGNGTALLEISNRGGKGLLNMFDLAQGSHGPAARRPNSAISFLLEQGYTLVWIGWEFDVPPSEKLLHLYAPIATNNGQPIVGMVRSEWEGDQLVNTIPLGDRVQIGYPVVDANDPENRIFVRDTVNGRAPFDRAR